MGLHTEAEKRRFIIFAEGKLREKVEEGTEGAKLREGDLPDGGRFSKWELTYPGITARITKVELQKGNFGKQVLIHLTDETDEEFVLALGASTRNGVNFMQALPLLDLTKEVSFKAYNDFVGKDGKEVIGGLSITQGGQKVYSYFYDPTAEVGKRELHGMPKPEVDKRTKEVDWTVYWPIRDKWLQDYLLDNNYMVYVDGTAEAAPTEKPKEEAF